MLDETVDIIDSASEVLLDPIPYSKTGLFIKLQFDPTHASRIA